MVNPFFNTCFIDCIYIFPNFAIHLISFQLTENLSKSNRKFGNVNNRRTYAPILTYNE